MNDALDDVVGLAALADPLRRQLYRYVVARQDPVGREEAAEALGVAVHTAKFHLDRMVEDGLLDVEFRRLTGRTGPGAGRPAKLYRRAGREFAVSLPERHYDLLSKILAEAVEVAAGSGARVDAVAAEVARREGANLGRAASSATGSWLERLAAALEGGGYEPRLDDGRLLLENCPFDRVARDHTDLVCGLNLQFVTGVLEGMECQQVTATLEPAAGRCCVSARPRNG